MGETLLTYFYSDSNIFPSVSFSIKAVTNSQRFIYLNVQIDLRKIQNDRYEVVNLSGEKPAVRFTEKLI